VQTGVALWLDDREIPRSARTGLRDDDSLRLRAAGLVVPPVLPPLRGAELRDLSGMSDLFDHNLGEWKPTAEVQQIMAWEKRRDRAYWDYINANGDWQKSQSERDKQRMDRAGERWEQVELERGGNRGEFVEGRPVGYGASVLAAATTNVSRETPNRGQDERRSERISGDQPGDAAIIPEQSGDDGTGGDLQASDPVDRASTERSGTRLRDRYGAGRPVDRSQIFGPVTNEKYRGHDAGTGSDRNPPPEHSG
jgi:hypothetical protein